MKVFAALLAIGIWYGLFGLAATHHDPPDWVSIPLLLIWGASIAYVVEG